MPKKETESCVAVTFHGLAGFDAEDLAGLSKLVKALGDRHPSFVGISLKSVRATPDDGLPS